MKLFEINMEGDYVYLENEFIIWSNGYCVIILQRILFRVFRNHVAIDLDLIESMVDDEPNLPLQPT